MTDDEFIEVASDLVGDIAVEIFYLFRDDVAATYGPNRKRRDSILKDRWQRLAKRVMRLSMDAGDV